MENIGKRIRDLRKAKDLTQTRLAEYLGVSEQAVSKWETSAATPDLWLIEPLTRILGVTADELLGIEQPKTDQRKEFEERVERIFRESWPGPFPPTFDTKKAAEEQLRRGAKPEDVTDEAVRSWIPYLKMVDEGGGEDASRTGTPGEEDFRDLLRFRALSGDADALDLLSALGPFQLTEGRRSGYARAFALAKILGAAEIVDIGCGDIPHIHTILDCPGLRYTGLCSWADNERFNRLLRPYVPDVKYEKKKYPCPLETGEGAMGLAFMFHILPETADGLMDALAGDFDRVLVQVWDDYEAAFRRAFAGFSVRILCEQEFYGRFTGTMRRRKMICFATRIREDIRTLDEMRYDWYDTRFLFGDDRFRGEYHRKWDEATRGQGSFHSVEVEEWFRSGIVPSFDLTEPEREILAAQLENRKNVVHFMAERTADGYVEAYVYRDPDSIPRLKRNGSGDFALDGPCSFEGRPYWYAAYVKDGLLRTIEAFVVPEDTGKPDRGFRFRGEWLRQREEWAKSF